MSTDAKVKPASGAAKPRRLTWRWLLVAALVIAIVAASAILLKQHIREFAAFGYLGAFLISLLAAATVVAFVPCLPIMIALGAVLNPWYVGLAAGTGEALGELVIYTAGRTGHAFFLKDRFVEAQTSREVHGIYPRLQRWVHHKGALAIFFSSAVFNPFFSLIGATAGATRFPAWKFFAAVWAGKAFKWLVVALLAKAILDKIPSWIWS